MRAKLTVFIILLIIVSGCVSEAGNTQTSIDSGNAGLTDTQGAGLKTNPYKADNDGDGIIDSEDPNPLVAETKETTPPTTSAPTTTLLSTTTTTTSTPTSTTSTTTTTTSTTTTTLATMELKYDNGDQDGRTSLGSSDPFLEPNNGGENGHALRFSTTSSLLKIDTVLVYGSRYGEDTVVRLEIWDEDKNVIYSEVSNQAKHFTSSFNWASISVPPTTVSGDFYVAIFTNSMNPNLNPTSGVNIGKDNSPPSGRSFIVEGTALEPLGDNWMMRVSGIPGGEVDTTEAPTTTATTLATKEIKNESGVFTENGMTGLKFDDGTGGGWTLGGQAHVVKFSPPSIPWSVKIVRVYGNRNQNGYFSLQIWDENFNILYDKWINDYSKFPTSPDWVDIPLPEDVNVSGDFYVFFSTHSASTGGLIVYSDDSSDNKRSFIFPDREEQNQRTELGNHFSGNWMIRVLGDYVENPIVPEIQGPPSLPTTATESNLIILDGNIDDWNEINAASVSDPVGDSTAKEKVGTDIKSLYVSCNDEEVAFILELDGSLDLSKLRNYFLYLDFNNDNKNDYILGFRPTGENWIFFDPNNNAEMKIASSSVNGLIEGYFFRDKHSIPQNFLAFARVTEGGPTVDKTDWFLIQCEKI